MGVFVGAAAGVRYLRDQRRYETRVGSVLVASGTPLVPDEAWGPSVTARAGLALFRTHRIRLLVTVDYNLTAVALHGLSPAQAVDAGIGVIF